MNKSTVKVVTNDCEEGHVLQTRASRGIIRYNSSYKTMEEVQIIENCKFSSVPGGNIIDCLAAQNIKLRGGSIAAAFLKKNS